MKSDTIIISIHPVFVEKILSGEKKYEFRKYFPAGVRYMLVYTTSPVKRITALVEIDTVLCDSPRNIWNKTRKQAGITKRFYDTYFKDKGMAYAVRLKKARVLNNPLQISDLKGIKAAPQSYIYLKEQMDNIIGCVL
ncbi:MAG: ASCH domain-containing protein [Bacteroidales bacterium]|nr:ASCH domain-containing protein [Bacteroidales bacterium]